MKTSEKLEQWIADANNMIDCNPSAALELTDKIIDSATTPEVAKYQVLGASIKSRCLRRIGRSDEALHVLEEAQRLHRRFMPHDKAVLMSILNSKGNAYLKKGNHQLALNAFLKCLPLSKEPKLFAIHNNIGIVYANIGNMPEAIKFWGKAEVSAESNANPISVANIKCNLVHCYVITGKIEHAKQKAQEVLALMEAHPDKQAQFITPYINVFNELGEIYAKEKDAQKALDVLQQALTKAEEASLIVHSCKTLNTIASVYFDINNEEKALYNIHKSLNYADKYGLREQKKTALESVIRFYESTNQPAQMLPFYEMLYDISQEQLAESRDENLQKIIAEREQEIQLLGEKNREIEEQNAILKQFA